MTIENLKTKIHAIFENCGMKHEEVETPIEIKDMKEDVVPPTPAPVVPPALVPTPAAPQAPTAQNKQEFKSASGIVYNIGRDATGNITVTDQTGADAKGKITPEELNAIETQLGGVQQTTTPPAQVTEPKQIQEPETTVAESQLTEVNKKALQNFIDQYGEEEGKKIYYATANAQGRSEETFKK